MYVDKKSLTCQEFYQNNLSVSFYFPFRHLLLHMRDEDM